MKRRKFLVKTLVGGAVVGIGLKTNKPRFIGDEIRKEIAMKPYHLSSGIETSWLKEGNVNMILPEDFVVKSSTGIKFKFADTRVVPVSGPHICHQYYFEREGSLS